MSLKLDSIRLRMLSCAKLFLPPPRDQPWSGSPLYPYNPSIVLTPYPVSFPSSLREAAPT